LRVLIVGSGAREHALAWKLRQSPRLDALYVSPGNAGIAQIADNLPTKANDVDGIVRLAQEQRIDLVVVGPEEPLTLGLVDRLDAAGIAAFGPSQAAAEIEASKVFAKELMVRHGIPTAKHGSFDSILEAGDYIAKQEEPLVIKADGLAAGKGVIIAPTMDEAVAAVRDMLAGNVFGEAGHRVVIEEFLQGEEASFIAMVDGEHILPLATSQDHKRVHDGDTGPNTGAYSPAPVVTPAMHARIMREVIEPTVRGMAAEGHPYTGFLYAGVMIAPDGTPRVLEYNCRFGDPETQPVMLRLKSDFIELIEAALDGRLNRVQAQWDDRAALGVVMAAGGYPGAYGKSDVISGLPEKPEPDCKVFHAGTALKDGAVVTSGGRVLCVTALGATVGAAQSRAYETVKKIHWRNAQYRRDIGYRAIAREKSS
jgi:phosphoribosylamine--glycine ligase